MLLIGARRRRRTLLLSRPLGKSLCRGREEGMDPGEAAGAAGGGGVSGGGKPSACRTWSSTSRKDAISVVRVKHNHPVS